MQKVFLHHDEGGTSTNLPIPWQGGYRESEMWPVEPGKSNGKCHPP
jgi:hypothetical protein